VPRARKWFFAGAFAIALLSFVAYEEWLGPSEVVWKAEIRDGNSLISQINSFQQSHGRLPLDLSELGNDTAQAAEKKGLSYERCSSGVHYIVWFGTTLGESVSYDSRSSGWKDENGPCD
jgi:hypothetical protein